MKSSSIGYVLILLSGIGCQHVNLSDDAVSPDPSMATLQNDGSTESEELTAEQSADACIATAEELERNGWEREAISVYQRALSFDPNRTGIAHRLARLHARTGESAAARELFERAVKETPNNADVFNDFGYFHFEYGDLEAAEDHLRRALELAPDDDRCRTNLALTLAAAERFQESLEFFEETVGPAAARSNLAVLLSQSGKLEESRSMLTEARALDPTIRQAEVINGWLNQETPKVDGLQVDDSLGVTKLD